MTIFLHWAAFVLWVVTIPFSANPFEWRVAPYALPDVLNGAETAADWETKRKPEILKLFENEVYGPIPTEPADVDVEILEEGIAFEGTDHEANRRQTALTLSRAGRSITLQLLIYTPVRCLDIEHREQRQSGCPAVLSLNPFGNHSLTVDPSVLPSTVWSQRIPGMAVPFKEESRNAWHAFLPVEELLARGYAVATVYYGDIDPDYDDGFKNGVHALYPEYAPGSWGSVSAWAWGMQRLMDHIGTDPAFDSRRVVLFGFSRLGKSALWAAANDARFAAVVSDSAGEGGDTLSKRHFGESIRLMTLRFPHWFNSTYTTYAGREDELPVDQHMLLALIAPRPLLVSAGAKDWWSDPKGAAEAISAARAAHELYGKGDALQYELHEGGHGVTLKEWGQYLQFLDRELSVP